MTSETSNARAPAQGAAILAIVVWMIVWYVGYNVSDEREISSIGYELIEFNGVKMEGSTVVPINTDTVLYKTGEFLYHNDGMLGDIVFWVWLVFCGLAAMFSVGVIQSKRLEAGGKISDDLY